MGVGLCKWFHRTKTKNGVTLCYDCKVGWAYSYAGGGGWVDYRNPDTIKYLMEEEENPTDEEWEKHFGPLNE